MNELSNDFWSGLGVGAALGGLTVKIISIVFKEWLNKNNRKKAAIAKTCESICDRCHKLVKATIINYCSEYNRDKSLELTADFKELAALVKELNKDLDSVNKSNYCISNSLIIDLRQKLTSNIFSLRNEKYNYTDPLIQDIELSSERLIEALKNISRQVF